MSIQHKIIANGAHGCIVSPALRCAKEGKTPRYRTIKTVGKIFRQKYSWESEQEGLEKLKKIPKYENYFILPLEHCMVEKKHLEFKEECKKRIQNTFPPDEDDREDDDENLYQLILSDGGVSVKEYILKKDKGIEIIEWLNILLKILNCFKILAENKLVHMDAKLENIVYDAATKNVRLIDFGLTTPHNQVYRAPDKIGYLYWPIEFKIYENCAKIYDDKGNLEIRKCDNTSIRYEFMSRISRIEFIDHYGIISSKEKEQKQIIDDIISSVVKDKNILLSEEYLNKIDLYSLGISCIGVHDKIIDIDSSMENYIREGYIALIHNMCKLDCAERISIDGAISAIMAILDGIVSHTAPKLKSKKKPSIFSYFK